MAYLVENLLGRGKECPSGFRTLEECLSKVDARDLNRPIGLIYWAQEGNYWTQHTEEAFTNNEVRSDSGNTYKVLVSQDRIPPGNAYSIESSVLSLAKSEQVAPLVEAGASPGLYFGDGRTALIDAVIGGDLVKAEALVASRASKTFPSAQGNSPCSFIDPGAHPEISEALKKLLECGDF